MFLIAVEWAPASLFLAQLYQRLGPFLEWGLSGDTFVVRWRDSTLYEIAKQRYIGNNEGEKKARQVLLDYFQVSFLSIYFPINTWFSTFLFVQL